MEPLCKCRTSLTFQNIFKWCVKDISKLHNTIAIKTAWCYSTITQYSYMRSKSLTETTFIAITAVKLRPFKWTLYIDIKMFFIVQFFFPKRAGSFLVFHNLRDISVSVFPIFHHMSRKVHLYSYPYLCSRYHLRYA